MPHLLLSKRVGTGTGAGAENSLPTGSITLNWPGSGAAVTFTENIADADGLGTFYYEWSYGPSPAQAFDTVDLFASGTDPIFNTIYNNMIMLPSGSYVGLTIKYTDGQGNSEEIQSSNVVGPSTSV